MRLKKPPPMYLYRHYCEAIPNSPCNLDMCVNRNHWCLAVMNMDSFKRKLIDIKIKRLQEKTENGK